MVGTSGSGTVAGINGLGTTSSTGSYDNKSCSSLSSSSFNFSSCALTVESASFISARSNFMSSTCSLNLESCSLNFSSNLTFLKVHETSESTVNVCFTTLESDILSCIF
jgi:hypothetical protein